MYHILFYDGKAYRQVQRNNRADVAQVIKKIRQRFSERIFVFHGRELIHGKPRELPKFTNINFGGLT